MKENRMLLVTTEMDILNIDTDFLLIRLEKIFKN